MATTARISKNNLSMVGSSVQIDQNTYDGFDIIYFDTTRPLTVSHSCVIRTRFQTKRQQKRRMSSRPLSPHQDLVVGIWSQLDSCLLEGLYRLCSVISTDACSFP